MFITTDLHDKRVITALVNGSVGILPTDTLYGLVAQAARKDAVQHLYELKQRHGKPGTVIASSTQQLIDLGIPARYLKPLEGFWPGAISVVVPTTPQLSYLDQGKFSLAMRVVADRGLSQLLDSTGPLLTTSANMPGKPPASTIKEAQDAFGDDLDFYVDGGDLSAHQPSTIIRVVDDAVEVLRKGAVKIDEERGEITT